MPVAAGEQQLVKYLTDVHSIEEQALTQMRRAPKLVEGKLAAAFALHLEETAEQERRVRARLQAHGASPSKVKDAAGQAGGIGMVLFARSQPDTPGKLTAHAFSYEHMELAAYELLSRFAERCGDAETATMAREIADQERAMAARLAECFDQAVEASLDGADAKTAAEHLDAYLADAHAIEGQSLTLLKKGAGIAGAAELAKVFEDHLAESAEQQRRLECRLQARGSSPSAVKDAALRVGALNWGAFMAAQSDTPAKLAGFAYALEHLEIGSYELLLRVAERAGDAETVAAVRQTLEEERAAASAIAAQWDAALDAA
jgi:ferritin-like metal-binding protein YciE